MTSLCIDGATPRGLRKGAWIVPYRGRETFEKTFRPHNEYQARLAYVPQHLHGITFVALTSASGDRGVASNPGGPYELAPT